MSAGKGDKPRNCFSQKFKDNYDEIFFEKYLEKLSERLYDEGWYTASIYIKKCKNKEECRKYIIEHCDKKALKLL